MWDIAECVEEKSDIKKKTLNGVKIKIIGIGKTGYKSWFYNCRYRKEQSR